MGGRQGTHHARSQRLAAALLVLVLAGCNGNYGYLVNVSSMGAPLPPPPNASISVTTTSAGGLLGALFGIGFIAAANGAFYYPPEMHPERRVIEQDCSKPIEDTSANLRCR